LTNCLFGIMKGMIRYAKLINQYISVKKPTCPACWQAPGRFESIHTGNMIYDARFRFWRYYCLILYSCYHCHYPLPLPLPLPASRYKLFQLAIIMNNREKIIFNPVLLFVVTFYIWGFYSGTKEFSSGKNPGFIPTTGCNEAF